MPSTDFDELVVQVQERAAAAEAAHLLDAAATVSAGHAADADRLLGHFVDQARSAGMTWTEIGARLGVSKQAARQRFSDDVAGMAPFVRTAPRLQACLDHAGELARADGRPEVGTEHLLAGLLAEGLAASILERLEVTHEGVRASSWKLFGEPAREGEQVPPLSPEASRALDTAARKAAADCHEGLPETRTEHVLAVLALDPGSRARRVLNDLGVDIAAVKRELNCYITFKSPRPSRWWKRRAHLPGCSFCGSVSCGQLVNGPGVAICRDCVALAGEILDNHPSGP